MTRDLELFGNRLPVMTVRQVSKVLGVTPEAIKRHTRILYPELLINGKTAYLNESQITEIKKYMKPTSEVVGNKTDLEMIKSAQDVLLWMTSKVKELEKENEALKPRAELADMALRDEKTNYSITDAGKHLGLSQGVIFAMLRDKRLLTGQNLPSQRAIDYGVLTLKSNVCTDGKLRQQAVMTMANIAEFKRRYIR